MPRLRTRIIPRPGGTPTDLTAPTAPAAQALASTETTASATWTHAGAPSGTTYACTVEASEGAAPTATGSGLGAWTWPVVAGRAYIATLTATGTDGQVAASSALVAVAPESTVAGAWTQIGQVNFIGATPQTFTTTGDKTVTLADASTVTVNATMSVGSITTGTAGVDATRGLIADLPGGAANTAYRLRVAVPVSPAVGSTDDLLAVVRWRVNMATATATFQRALVGLTTSSGTEASTEFSGGVLQNSTSNVVKLQSRKTASVADVAASVPTGWRDGTTLVQAEVRVVGKVRTLFATAASRNVDTGTPTYSADIGGDSSGPSAGLDAPLFSGATVYVQFYNWNGGTGGPATAAAIEQIDIYKRTTSRVP